MTKRIQKIFEIFDLVNDQIPLKGIRLTAGQLSLILDTPNMSISFDTIKKGGDLIKADYLQVHEDNIILSLFEGSYTDDDFNEDIQYLGQVVVDMADIICPCTGNEIFIDKNEIKCYLDVQEIDIDQFKRINDLFEDTGLIIFTHRPYIVFNRDIQEESIFIEEIGR